MQCWHGRPHVTRSHQHASVLDALLSCTITGTANSSKIMTTDVLLSTRSHPHVSVLDAEMHNPLYFTSIDSKTNMSII